MCVTLCKLREIFRSDYQYKSSQWSARDPSLHPVVECQRQDEVSLVVSNFPVIYYISLFTYGHGGMNGFHR